MNALKLAVGTFFTRGRRPFWTLLGESGIASVREGDPDNTQKHEPSGASAAKATGEVGL